jgi:hypothetical protein
MTKKVSMAAAATVATATIATVATAPIATATTTSMTTNTLMMTETLDDKVEDGIFFFGAVARLYFPLYQRKEKEEERERKVLYL